LKPNPRSSSLQRLESSNKKLERRFSQIEVLIGEVGKNTSADYPEISAIPNTTSKLSLLSAGLMGAAEDGRRKWSAIGVDEWIEAGKWWLIKVVYRGIFC
jgi:hypothetical protein